MSSQFALRYSHLPLALVLLALMATQAQAAPKLDQPMQEARGARLLTSTGLPCPGPRCGVESINDGLEPQAQGLRKVYLNFEGVTLTASNNNEDAVNNISFILAETTPVGNTRTIAPFSKWDLSNDGGGSRQEIIDYTVAQLRETHQPYNVEFVMTRPSSGTYHMVVFGGTCAAVVGDDCAGIAHLDCSDAVPSNIVFAFPNNRHYKDLAATASQELAHAFGLSHTNDTDDIMYPFVQTPPPTQYGAGTIPNQDQSTACGGSSYQDSHQRLLDIVGFAGQDTVPPSVRITAPSSGAKVSVGDPVRATITDDGQIAKVELLLNGAVMSTKTSAPYDFSIPASAPQGQVFVDIKATDSSGNDAKARVTVYIGSGNEEACVDGKCPDGFNCVESLCYPAETVTTGSLGDVCVGSGDCESTICAEVEEEKRCSQDCNADNPCPTGFECIGDTACWPAFKSGDSGLCSVSGSSRGALGSLGLIFFAIMLGSRNRRRRR